jgi:AhpD family alkylhydroperoxidase
MEARLDIHTNPVARKALKHLVAAGQAAEDSPLPAATRELVLLRASQINGCGFCVDMHSKDARHIGESEERIQLVAAFDEAPAFFSEKERAALALTESVTVLTDGFVPDAVYERAAEHFEEEELAQLRTMCREAGLPPLVRSDFRDSRPANFAFLIRPTLKELQDIHATLDKLMSDNLNKGFFTCFDIELERDYLYGKALAALIRDTSTGGGIDLGAEVELTHLKMEETFAGSVAPIVRRSVATASARSRRSGRHGPDVMNVTSER